MDEQEINRLLALLKEFVDKSQIDFPAMGRAFEREARSEDGHETFLVDVNRKGSKKPSKCTFQERYAVSEILLRLDIDGPPHENPDGVIVPCPHLHICKEGYGTKWAFPIDPKEFSDTSNLVQTFREFLARCNITNVPDIQGLIT